MPNLTSRELTAIEEQLDAEKVLVAKYRQFANETADPALSNTLMDISNKHQQHYDSLFKYLN